MTNTVTFDTEGGFTNTRKATVAVVRTATSEATTNQTVKVKGGAGSGRHAAGHSHPVPHIHKPGHRARPR